MPQLLVTLLAFAGCTLLLTMWHLEPPKGQERPARVSSSRPGNERTRRH